VSTAGWLSIFWLRYGASPSTTSDWTTTTILSGVPLTLSSLIYTADPELLENLWPQWMNHYYAAPLSGSFFHNFSRTNNSDLLETGYYIDRLKESLRLSPTRNLPRAGWICETTTPPESIQTVSISISYGTISLKHCITEYDFLDALTPCFICLDGAVYLRNLNRVLVTDWSITGSLSIPAAEIVPEDDLIVDYGVGWSLFPITSASLVGSNYVFSIPVTGTIDIVYSSKSLLTQFTTGSAIINNGPALSLQTFDFWSRFDELGLLRDVTRFNGEDNSAYFARIKAAGPFAFAPTKYGLAMTVGCRLDMVGTGLWDGSTITISQSLNAKYARLADFNQRVTAYHELIKSGSNYYGVAQDWVLSEVFHGQEVITTLETSGYITPSFTPTESIIGIYRFDTFTLTTSGDIITAISINSNTPNINSMYIYVRGLEVETLGRPSYLETLYNLDGSPTTTLFGMADYIKEKAKVTLGYTTWNRAPWFSFGDVMPDMTYLVEGFE